MKTIKPKKLLPICPSPAPLALILGLATSPVWANPITGDFTVVDGAIRIKDETPVVPDKFEFRLGENIYQESRIDFWHDNRGEWVWSYGAPCTDVMSLDSSNRLSLYDLGATGDSTIVLDPGNPAAASPIQPSITIGGSTVLTTASAPSILTSAGFVTASPTGLINLNGTTPGISANGNSIFSLDGAGKVSFANNRPMNITSTNSSSSSSTGALVVAGGIGAAKDSFFGSVRIGKGESSGSFNTVLGESALSKVGSTGTQNTAIGTSALRSTTSGSYNTAVGVSSLYYNTTGQHNTAFGLNSLVLNTTGISNAANGVASLYSNTNGSGNVAFGNLSGYSNISGNFNSAFGQSSMYSNTSGSYNIALGILALFSNTTGSSNVAIGREAGRYHANGTTNLTDPENSIYIGAYSKGKDNDDNKSIVIGYEAIGEGANTTVIGGPTTKKTHLIGETNADSLKVAGATVLSGAVIISVPQGDISMGIYGD